MRIITRRKICLLAIVSSILFSSMSYGALINRGSGMIYDDVLDITWLQDANYMFTSGASATEFVNHTTAFNWVDNLVFGGLDDWRLPNFLPGNGVSYDFGFSFDGSTDRGFNNTGLNNELGHLFANSLNNVSFFNAGGVGSQPGSDTFNSSFVDGESGLTVSFNNIGISYWANPANDPIINAAWGYNFRNFTGISTGETQLLGLASNLSVWAVRDGDVQSTLPPPPATPPTGVPEPGSFALILLGLVGSVAARKFT